MPRFRRSEEHTSELQSHVNLVCRLLLEKKKLTHPRRQSLSRAPARCTLPRDRRGASQARRRRRLFFCNDTATTEIYTLSLHDALPISFRERTSCLFSLSQRSSLKGPVPLDLSRSEEHTSELQSHVNLVCRLLLEK